MTITDRLKAIECCRLRRLKEQLLVDAFSKPLMTDIEALPKLYARFKEVCNTANMDNTKIFILIVFYLYSPVSLISKRIVKGPLRRKVGEVLGISGSAVTRHFADAKILFAHHQGFKEETERVFSALND